MSLRNLDVGLVIIYSGHNEVHTWRPGNHTVLIHDPDTGIDIDVYSWAEAPKSIDVAIDMAENRMAMLEEANSDYVHVDQDWSGWLEEMGGFNPIKN